jgi:rod shape-determining protein MreD
MIYCFYIGVCLCLVILQTAVLPHIPLLATFYDLIVAFIIYLGLYRPLRDGLILALFLGFIMDNLSGSPFGIYLTTYCWLLISVKWITTIIQVGNRVLLSVVVAAGILIENFVFLSIFSIQGDDSTLPAGALRTVIIQVIWALFTGPLMLLFFKYSQRGLESLMSGYFAGNGNHGS